jgi:hypothetical protein
MLTRTKIALAAALVLASASAAFAQAVVPEVDGDGNRTGLFDVLPQANSPRARGSIERSFAGPRQDLRIERSFAGPRQGVREPLSAHGANGTEWQLYFDNWLSRGGQGSGATLSGFQGR